MNAFKKFIFGLCIMSSNLLFFNACDDANDPLPAPPIVGQIGNGDQEFNITKDTVYKKGTYILKGWVSITDGVTVTFEPGTIIKGDKDTKAALIVQRGGKLMARGTATEPIVFTSNQPAGNRKPGDWGGLIICGKAKNNNSANMPIEGGPNAPHGGDNDNDNSGIISYVRIEFAGYPFEPDQEINGITFGSVGKGTQADHIQVSYSNDDSFEWFGGSVNAKYLVAYHGWDDDFDTDYGYSGKLQFLLGVRNPKIADTSLSNGFESDNNKDGSTQQPYTSCVFSNVTLVGPIGQASDFQNTSDYINGGNYNPHNGSKLGIFQSAMQVRRNSRLSCFNSVAFGFPVGLIIENDKGSTTQTWATEGLLKLKNLHFAEMTVLGSDANKSFEDNNSFSAAFFKKEENNNHIYETIADLKLKQPNSILSNPNWGPSAGSPLLGAGSFTDPLLQSGFEKVDYIGAFKSDSDTDNWMKGWTNFDPQNTEY